MKRQKKKKTLAFKNAVAGYLFILPFILGFILFMVVPLISSLRMTFNDVTPTKMLLPLTRILYLTY